MATEKKIPPNFFWQETSLKVHLEAAQWGKVISEFAFEFSYLYNPR